MYKRTFTVIHINADPIGSIGNVDVYKTASGYCLVERYDSSKFKFIR